MDNCIELETKLPKLRKWFVFFDDLDHSAASLFNRYQVPIKVKCAWKKEGEKYRTICCKVRRRDVPRFKKAMEDLKVKMLLIGNTDYEAFCESFMKETDKETGN